MKFLSQINVNTEYTLPIVDGSNGQVLTTDGSGAVYWGSVSVGAINLDGLTDVVISSPTSGQILRYGIPIGSEDPNPVWYNWTPNFLTFSSSIDALGDVTISSASVGQLLRWNGSQWVNWTPNFLTSYTETDTLASVTTRGNVTTNTIDVGGVKSDYFLFDTAATPTLSAGMMRWNDSDGTAEIALKYGDVVLQLGQEQHYVVRNATGTTIENGTALYASGVTAGSGRIEASPYVADGSIREVRFLGLATHDISNGINGVVTHFGYVRGLDTRGTAPTAISVGDEDWSVGDILYVHPTEPGKLTNVKPKHEITVAIIINRHQNSGVLFVRPSSAGHLDDIHDVILNGEADGQLLRYDGESEAWVNWTPNFLTSYTETDPTVPSHVKSITTTNISNWNTAYGWGNHATQGYATQTWVGLNYYNTGQIDDFFSGAEPISGYNKSNWDTAYGWGNHASAGYLTSYTETDTLASVIGRGAIATHAIFTGDTQSRVLYLRGSGNIIQFQDASSANKWEIVGREGQFYIYKNDGIGSGYKYQIDTNGNHTITGDLSVTGGFSASGYNKTNWDTAYNDRITAASVAGTGTKTLTLTQGDGSTITATWVDYDTDTDAQTLTWEAGTKTLGISGGNDITLDGLATEEFVTGQGYITGYTETDTLATVTARGASTTSAITVRGITSTKDTNQITINRIDGGGATWQFYSWNGGLNIFPNTELPVYIGRDGSVTDLSLWNGKLLFGTKDAVDGNSDSWLRLNNSGSYASGVYTPGQLRSDGLLVNYGGARLYAGTVANGNIELAGTVSLGDFTSDDADEWPKVYWYRNTPLGWDEGLIKASSSRGFFGKSHYGIHFDSSRAFGFFTSGWTKLFGIEASQADFLVTPKHNGEQLATRAWVQAQGYLTSETDSQTLEWDGVSKNLTITNGNTVTLDGLLTNEDLAAYGYITGESDTLATVTARGATTSSKVFFTHHTNSDPLSAVEINGGGTHTGLYINPAASSQAHVRFGTNGTLKWQIRAPFQDSVDTALKFYSWVSGADKFQFEHSGNAIFNGGNVWTSANDGSGSGLDADLLDGYNHSNFIGLNGNSYFQLTTWLQSTGSHGFYSPSSGAGTHFYPAVTSYGSFRIEGGANGFLGIELFTLTRKPTWMWDNNGGGMYSQSDSVWYYYYSHSTGRLHIGASSGNAVWHSGDFTSTNISNWNTAYGWGNHAGLYIPINPDGDGPAWAYSDENPTINGTYIGGRQSFGADGDAVTGGALQARLINAYEGHVNSTYGYYVGNLNYGGDSGTYTTTQVINASGTFVGPSVNTSSVVVTASEGREVQTYMPSSYTTDDLVAGHEYGWYNDHWRLGMTRTGGAAGGDFVIQWNGARRLSLTNGGGLVVTGNVVASGGNSTQWNAAYGWGNHAGLYLPLSGGTISGNLNVSGQLAFPDGGGNYTNIIRSAGYPSEGYPSEFTYWLEYRAYGGHHFVLNVDGGVGSGENPMDDFVIWQGAIDGDRLLELTNAGNLTIRGTFTESSSIRFKENIKPLEPALSKVEQLNPVTYNKIGVEEEEIGLIAEEVAELFPEVVTYNEEGQPQGIQYQRLSVILLKAVQELTERVNKLENK